MNTPSKTFSRDLFKRLMNNMRAYDHELKVKMKLDNVFRYNHNDRVSSLGWNSKEMNKRYLAAR